MRKLAYIFFIALFLFILSGCAGVPRVLIPETLPAASIHVDPSKNLEPIAFEKGIVALTKGTEIGSGGVMLNYGGDNIKIDPQSTSKFCTYRSNKIHWGIGSAHFGGRQEEFNDFFYKALSASGYDVVGGPKINFEKDDTKNRATYKVAAKIIDLKANVCEMGHWWDGRPLGIYAGEAYVKVEWSIYSAIERKTVTTITTDAYMKNEEAVAGGIAFMVLGAFENSAKKLASNKKFYNVISSKPIQPVTIPKSTEEQIPQSGTGSGFFVSKMGHVITNAHVVQSCNKVTIGDNANKQVPAEVVNTDKSNDLALLKLSTLEMASTESKSLIQKLGIVVVPLASKGLLRSEDVRLGEKILVAGYPFGDAFSNSIKVTTGVVSSIRGVGDDSGQFQLDAAVQPGNSGGPIYDSSGNIVGVVISQLNKRTFGSLVENVNFGVKASTVRQFLVSSGLSSKKSERTEEKSTEQLAEIAQNQALMVMCLQ